MRATNKLIRTLCLGAIVLGILIQYPDHAHAADPGFLSSKKETSVTEHVLKAGDKLQMLVYREADLTSLVTIDKSGSILLPLIGEIKVSGMTVKQARSQITDLYNRDYLVNPQVTLNHLAETEEPGRVTVIGRVGSAGAYSLPKGAKQMPLLEAIALAGGFTRYASTSGVKIRRRENGTQKVYTVNAKKLAEDPKAQQFFVIPGDHITVSERIF